MTTYEMGLLEKVKKLIFRKIESDVNENGLTEFQLKCVHAAAEIDAIERRQERRDTTRRNEIKRKDEKINYCGNCAAFNVYIDGGEDKMGAKLENVIRVNLPAERKNLTMTKISELRIAFDHLEAAQIALERREGNRRIEIREAIQYLNNQGEPDIETIRHVIEGEILAFEQSPVELCGKREVMISYKVNRYTVYSGDKEILNVRNL